LKECSNQIIGGNSNKICITDVILMIIVLMWPFLMEIVFNKNLTIPSSFLLFFLSILILYIMCRVFTYFHEYCHKITAYFLGYKTKISFKKRICEFEKDVCIERNSFIIIALAPLLSLLIVFICLLFIT
jgi:hypothetical protein